MKKLFSLVLAVCLLSALCLPASAATQFTDVSGTEWYAPAVNYCAENAYMNGTGGGEFTPGGKVSRAQMAQILYNFSDKPDVTGLENPFADVGNEWYRAAIIFVKAVGVVNGTSSTTYSPNDYITREQVAVMLSNYYVKSTKTTITADLSFLDSYTDKNTVSSWAKDSVAWAIDNRIMSGTGNGKLDPKGTCTRAQLAQFIMNYCDNLGKPTPIEPDAPNPSLPDIPGFPKDGKFEPLPEDWLPKGGYWDDSHTHKYNMYGIDITDVDGVPDTNEIQTMAIINQYRVENGLPELKWNTHAQVLAEIRAYEATYNFAHARPDGSNCFRHTDSNTNNICCQYLSTNNFMLLEEIGLDDTYIDAEMVDAGKTLDRSNGAPCENLGSHNYSQTNLAALQVASWQNSPGHNNALLANFGTKSGYFAIGYTYDTDKLHAIGCYSAYGVNWIADGEQDWIPGRGIDYDSLGLTLDDIPYEYPDWILRDPDMDLESYGPTDHDINSLTNWLIDNGIEEDSNTMYQIKAHYFSTLSMDDYIKFMFSNTNVFHYMNLMPGEWSDITEMWDSDITFMKKTLVSNVADKITYQHMAENNHSDTKCDVCGKNHAEKNDLVSAEQIVNQFFMDTYGFDISAY